MAARHAASELGELQRLALDSVARRWCSTGGDSRPVLAAAPIAAGLAELRSALPADDERGETRRGEPTDGPVDRAIDGEPADALPDVLRQTAWTTDALAAAGLRAAGALAAAGLAEAADVADALSTCAQSLRMLAELELAAIPGP